MQSAEKEPASSDEPKADSPAVMPVRFRTREQAKPKTVSDMKVGEAEFVELSAIRIDKNWGVWLDPEHVVCEQDWRGGQPGPVEVKRLEEGFSASFLYAFNAYEKTWERDTVVEKFKGFIPVSVIDR